MFTHLEKHFANVIGARLKHEHRNRALNAQSSVALSVEKDKKGEFFRIVTGQDFDPNGVIISPVDVNKHLRHILLLVRDLRDQRNVSKMKMLCGHDERQFYVASIENEAVNIRSAFESLKPFRIQELQKNLNPSKRNKRHNSSFLRQGEWFFIPVQHSLALPKDIHIFKNEPISRGAGSSPHIVQEVVRFGGDQVWVRRGKIYTLQQMEELLHLRSDIRPNEFMSRIANAMVYGRGTVRHRDHYTVTLNGWHEIHLSREARRAGNLFLD